MPDRGDPQGVQAMRGTALPETLSEILLSIGHIVGAGAAARAVAYPRHAH
jgi:hypothetical protein